MRRDLAAIGTAVLAATFIWGVLPAEGATKTPDKITSVSSSPGPGVGQITIRWKSGGDDTTSFAIETALTSFSKSATSTLPRTGRRSKVFTVSGKKRSLTLSAAQVAAAGAAPATGNHLYYRVSALNGSKTREFGHLRAAVAKPTTPKVKGTRLRIGSFNVRSAKSGAGVRPWLTRLPEVAGEIKAWDPDVLAVQELSSGRADGKSGATTAQVPRQTESLVNRLRKTGRGKYRLVRTTSYVKPGTNHGTQATRILYDSSALTLLSKCPNKTGSRQYNTSCSFDLPIISGESRSHVRSAAYAEFRHKKTGKRFLFVSVHLDHRQSDNLKVRQGYDRLRGAQAAAVYRKISKIRRGSEPVIVAGDFNSWQNNPAGNSPHDYLVGKGYYDTAAARKTVGIAYSTFNGFAKTQGAAGQGYGNRLDQILLTGAKGARKFTTVTRRVDSARPSDHNLVVADATL